MQCPDTIFLCPGTVFLAKTINVIQLSMAMIHREPRRKSSPKKTEALEIRVSREEKAAFLEACRKVGRSASAVIRDAMRAYANFGPMGRTPGRWVVTISAFGGAAVGAALIAGLVAPKNDVPTRLYGMQEYASLDLNMDLALTYEEWLGREVSAQAVLANPQAGGNRPSDRYGSLVGHLIKLGFDPERVSQQTQTLNAACWSALNNYLADEQRQVFDHLDQNADGTVTPLEYSIVQEARLRVQFMREDKDGNGLIEAQDESLPVRDIPESVLGRARPTITYSPANMRAACDNEGRSSPYPQHSATIVVRDGQGNLIDFEYAEGVDVESTQARREPSRVWIGRVADYDRDGAINFEEYLSRYGS